MRTKFALIFVLLLVGCTKVTQEQIDTAQLEAEEAERVVDQWYDLVAAGDFEAAANFFDEKVLSETTPEGIVRVLSDFDTQHGRVKETTFQKFYFPTLRLGSPEKGTVVALTFDVVREKRQTVEQFDLIK